MIEKVCLPIKNYSRCAYVCNETYFNYIYDNKLYTGEGYQVINDDMVCNMEELITYCLTYSIEIDIPDGYTVTKLYSIVFGQGNFDPDDRITSTCESHIVCSSTDEKYIKNKFKQMCKHIRKKSSRKHRKWFCWHTEDFAYNQIIHSYNLCESYLVRKNKDIEVEVK